MVAAARALASKGPQALIDDPYAEALVAAVGLKPFTAIARGQLDHPLVDDILLANIRLMVAGMGLRTRYFDEHFHEVAAAGTRQVVILASGLDTRAYRMRWPAGTIVYEIDQPAVIEFKTTHLAERGVEPAAAHRLVPIDLRADWPAALLAAGFSPTRPTVWSAEGLLVYLDSAAQDGLLDRIDYLSAPGSSVVADYNPAQDRSGKSKAGEISAGWHRHGVELDVESLWATDERSRVVSHLRNCGWHVDSRSFAGLFECYADDGENPFGEMEYSCLIGRRGGSLGS